MEESKGKKNKRIKTGSKIEREIEGEREGEREHVLWTLQIDNKLIRNYTFVNLLFITC
jgi:hypothetical protein